jgi:hypothetical protein
MLKTQNQINEINVDSAEDLWLRISPGKQSVDPLGKYIYRGQSDSSWGLVPSILRKNVHPVSYLTNKGDGLAEWENRIGSEVMVLNMFVANCDEAGLAIPGDSIQLRAWLAEYSLNGIFGVEYWPDPRCYELMAIAQHYGVPTRFLDWTKNPYIAAYFAAEKYLNENYNPSGQFSVWAFDTMNMFGGSVFNLSIVPVPGSNNKFIQAQHGVFSVLRQRIDLMQNKNNDINEKKFNDLFDSELNSDV